MLPNEAIAYLENMPKDEPVFILRGHDKFTPASIACWAGMVQSPLDHKNPASPKSIQKAHEARQVIKSIRAWQESNLSRVKIPD